MSLLFMSRPIKKEIVRNGLVLWLEGRDFYNSPPTSTWIDKSGNNNNGTPSGFVYTSVSGSDGNGRVAFDGIDDRIVIPYNSNQNLLNKDFTINATVVFNSIGGFTPIISRRTSSSTNAEFVFSYNGANMIEFKYTIDGSIYTSCLYAFSPSTGIQYDFTIERVGDSLYLFINNIQHETINAITGTIYNSNASLCIGATNSSDTTYGNFVNEKVKRVLFYKRSLTSNERMCNFKLLK